MNDVIKIFWQLFWNRVAFPAVEMQYNFICLDKDLMDWTVSYCRMFLKGHVCYFFALKDAVVMDCKYYI